MAEAERHDSDGPRRRTRAMAWWFVVALLAVLVAVVAVFAPRREATPEDSPEDPRDAAQQRDSIEARRAADSRPQGESTASRRSAGRRPRSDSPETHSAQEEADAVAEFEEGTTAVTVRVVTEDGQACREGTVAFKPSLFTRIRRGTASLEHLHDASLAGGNPVVLADLPDDMDDLGFEATALVPGMASATAEFTVRARQVTSVELVVPKGRSAEVRVIESETGAPVAGASVVSLTEAERRGVPPRGLRGTSGLGAAVADPDGTCVVGGLGPDEHEFLVDAPGHRRAKAKWSAAALTVRLERITGTGTVTVTVLAPDGNPAAGVVVEQANSDRTETTGPDGRARFDDVPDGLALFSLQFDSLVMRDDFRSSTEKLRSGFAMMAHVEVVPGGSHEVEMGMRRAAAGFEGRLVTEDGSPIGGVKVSLLTDFVALHDTTTDEAGFVRLLEVASSALIVLVNLAEGTTWMFEPIEVKQGERATATWTLGSIELRGRLIEGAGRTPVAGAKVFASGPLSGSTTTDAKGEFAFTRARAGSYRVEVHAESTAGLGAHPVDVTIPAEKAVVIELVRCGEIVVRFHASDRAALRGAEVLLTSAEAETPDLSPPDSGDDDLVAHDVVPGRYEVVVELAGRRRVFPAEVKSGETTVVEVRAP
jgi:hypothetical protein